MRCFNHWNKSSGSESAWNKTIRRPLWLDQSAAVCDRDRFRAAENTQLREDVAQMPFHRGLADEEIYADFLVAFAARQQRQHSQFPAGQGFAAHACCKLFHQRLRYASVATVHLPDIIQQFLTSSLF